MEGEDREIGEGYMNGREKQESQSLLAIITTKHTISHTDTLLSIILSLTITGNLYLIDHGVCETKHAE